MEVVDLGMWSKADGAGHHGGGIRGRGYYARVSKFGLGKTLLSERLIASRPIQGIFKYRGIF